MENNENIDLGTFYVDVQLQSDGKFDVYLSHENWSGRYYTDMTVDEIGEYLADDIEYIAEEYKKGL